MKSFFLFFVMFILFCGCDEDEPVTLFSKTWKVSMRNKHKSTNPKGSILNNAWDICEQDDLYTFQKDGYIRIDPGDNLCGDDQPIFRPYLYDPKTGELIIQEGASIFYEVNEVSNTQLKYSAKISAQTGYNYLVFLFE